MKDEPCDFCQTTHCPTTWAVERIASLEAERDEARSMVKQMAIEAMDDQWLWGAVRRWEGAPDACQHLNADRHDDGWHCNNCGFVGELGVVEQNAVTGKVF